MSGRVIIVHNEPAFVVRLASALRLAGCEVTSFVNPMAALGDFESEEHVDLLVTRVDFEQEKSNGIALARMVRMKRPGIKILFTARREFAREPAGLGEFMALPVRIPDVVNAVWRLLRPASQPTTFS